MTTFASQNLENSIAKTIKKSKKSQKIKPTKRHGGGIASSALDNNKEDSINFLMRPPYPLYFLVIYHFQNQAVTEQNERA